MASPALAFSPNLARPAAPDGEAVARWARFEALMLAQAQGKPRPVLVETPPPPTAPLPRPRPRRFRLGAVAGGAAACLAALAVAALLSAPQGWGARHSDPAPPTIANRHAPAALRHAAATLPPRADTLPSAPVIQRPAPLAPKAAALPQAAPTVDRASALAGDGPAAAGPTRLTGPLPTPRGAVSVAAPWIVVHVPPGADARSASVTAALRATGLPVSAKPVALQVMRPSVRYFHPEDAAAAARVRDRLVRARPDAAPPAVADFTAYRPAPPRGLIEVWLQGG